MFSLRVVYGATCSTDFLLYIKSFVSKKILISVVYYKYTTSGKFILLMKFLVDARLAN